MPSYGAGGGGGIGEGEMVKALEQITGDLTVEIVKAFGRIDHAVGKRPYGMHPLPEREQVRRYLTIRENPEAWAQLVAQEGPKKVIEENRRLEALSKKYPEEAIMLDRQAVVDQMDRENPAPPPQQPAPVPAGPAAATGQPGMPSPGGMGVPPVPPGVPGVAALPPGPPTGMPMPMPPPGMPGMVGPPGMAGPTPPPGMVPPPGTMPPGMGGM